MRRKKGKRKGKGGKVCLKELVTLSSVMAALWASDKEQREITHCFSKDMELVTCF